MNRREYINKLSMYLQGLPSSELQDILSDYEEHFDIGLSKGKTEEEISAELGDPKEVADSYKANFKNINKENETRNYTTNDNSRKFLIGIMLIAFNLIIVLGPYMALLGVLLSFYGIGIGFTIGGIAILFGLPFQFFIPMQILNPLTSISFGVGLGSLGILILILSLYLTKFVYKYTVKYIQWNIELTNR